MLSHFRALNLSGAYGTGMLAETSSSRSLGCSIWVRREIALIIFLPALCTSCITENLCRRGRRTQSQCESSDDSGPEPTQRRTLRKGDPPVALAIAGQCRPPAARLHVDH